MRSARREIVRRPRECARRAGAIEKAVEQQDQQASADEDGQRRTGRYYGRRRVLVDFVSNAPPGTFTVSAP